MKTKRNEPCPCGSGKKYKNCCLSKEQKETSQSHQSSKETDSIIAFNPEAEKEYNQALACIKEGDLASAQKIAKRLSHLYPHDYMVNYLQGICFIQEEKLNLAIFHFEKSVQLHPLFSEAHFNLGGLYQQEGMILNAAACFKTVIEIEEKNSELNQMAQEALDFIEEIVRKTEGLSLDKYIEGNESFDQAFTYLNEGEYEEAIVWFQKVLLINPKHVQSYGNMALAYNAIGKQKKALECLDKALSLDPTYEPARHNRQLILSLAEGEKFQMHIHEIDYYKDGLQNLDGK